MKDDPTEPQLQDGAPPGSDTVFAARPDAPLGVARQVGLNAVLGAVLGTPRAQPTVGSYTLEEKVGEGGMGVVYRARDAHGDEVALKLLRSGEEPARRRFDREAAVLRSIKHPRVARYLEHGVTSDGQVYLAMEWLEGHDLSERLQKGALPQASALRAAVAAAEGLEAAHAAGVVHRDVKPSNLFLVGGSLDELRVIDFGIARVDSVTHQTLTATGTVLGTPAYMAPEQIRGEPSVATDVYGLGATLFEMLTGRPPFAGHNPAMMMLAVMAERAPSPRAIQPEVSGPLAAFVQQMLAKDPAERPADMTIVIAELSDLVLEARPAIEAPILSLRERRRPAQTDPVPASTQRGAGPLLGRARELGQLRGLLEDCLEEGLGNAVLIRSPEGMGASRLLEEFLKEEAVRTADLLLRVGCAPGGGAFGDVRRLVEASPADGALAEPRAELLRLLGQVSADRARGDEIRVAWSRLVDAWALRGRTVLIVEDGHQADQMSLRYLFRAGRRLGEGPTLSIITFRPGPILDRGRQAVDSSWFIPMELGPLRPRTIRRLARRWVPGAGKDAVDQLAEASGGNPGRLRMLVGATGHGAGYGDPLHELEPELKRVLRAASIVGRHFWPAPLERLLGEERDAAVGSRLGQLVKRKMIRRVRPSAMVGEEEYAFVSERLCGEAYAMCLLKERASGHREVASWLATRGDHEAESVAAHLLAAGRPRQALPHLRQAARTALAVGEPEHARRLLERGLALASTDGELLALLAEAQLAEGQVEAAPNTARRALAHLSPDAAPWFEATRLVLAHGGALDDERVEAVIAQAPRDFAAAEAKVFALGSVAEDLPARARPPIAEALEKVRRKYRLGPTARGWLHRARAAASGLQGRRRALEAAYLAFNEAGAVREAAETHARLAEVCLHVGDWEQATELADGLLETASMLGCETSTLRGRYLRGALLAETGGYARARSQLVQVLDGSAPARLEVSARVVMAVSALRADAVGDARAVTEVGDGVAMMAARGLVQAWHGGTRVELARTLEGEGEDLGYHEPLVRLAVAEIYRAAGAHEDAARAIRSAHDHLLAVARSFDDERQRTRLLSRPFVHSRIHQLWREWTEEAD